MLKKVNRNETRKKRHRRSRSKITGSQSKPRLNIYRSNNNMYAQIIDDVSGETLVAASTLDKDLKEKLSSTHDKDAAKMVGQSVGKKALDKDIEEVVFDRGGHIYHGRIKELAEGAREAGLKF